MAAIRLTLKFFDDTDLDDVQDQIETFIDSMVDIDVYMMETFS